MSDDTSSVTVRPRLANAQALGFVFAVASALGFSWKAILAKLAYRSGVDATTVLGLRMGFALPAYLGMAIWGVRARVRSQAQTAISGHLDIADGLTIAGLGVFGYYLASYLDFFALTRISAGLERLILFLYPSLVVLLVALRDRRRIGTRELQALVLGYAGIVCVFVSDSGRAPQGSAAWFGVLAVFASTITYSLYLVGAERVLAKVGSLLFTGVAMTCACVASLTVFFVSGHDLTHIPARAIYLCALMAAFSTVGPTWLLTEAMRRIGPGRAALCGMLGPVTTVGLEVLLLGETAGWSDLLGTALVLGSVWLLTRARTHQ